MTKVVGRGDGSCRVEAIPSYNVIAAVKTDAAIGSFVDHDQAAGAFVRPIRRIEHH
jgi:hypothetical protein